MQKSWPLLLSFTVFIFPIKIEGDWCLLFPVILDHVNGGGVIKVIQICTFIWLIIWNFTDMSNLGEGYKNVGKNLYLKEKLQQLFIRGGINCF